MIQFEINANNYNDFVIIDAHDGIERQFILTRYGRSYTMLDIGNPHYLKLDQSMAYVFKVQPGFYKADIEEDSIFITTITEEDFNNAKQSD